MGRTRRMGVALVLAPPVAYEVDGLRRALGDGALGSVAPHLTLVPPVNIARERVNDAVHVVRTAAAWAGGALGVKLGPVRTFLPDSPVLYLGVDEPGADAAARLREQCLQSPLDRPGRWPFVAHVTVCDEVDAGRAEAAVRALASYRCTTMLDRLVLLEQTDGAWHELADAAMGRVAIWGRGGLETRAITGSVPAPDVLALFDAEDARPWESSGPVADMLVVTACRDVAGSGQPPVTVGAGVAWCGPLGAGTPHVAVVVGPAWRGQGLGRSLVQALAGAALDRGWSATRARGHGPLGFFSASSPWAADLGD